MQFLTDIHILSIVTYVPLAGALAIVFLFPKTKAGPIKGFATAVAVLDFAASLPLWFAFDRGKDGYQFVERASWIAVARRRVPLRHRRDLAPRSCG